MGRPWVAIRAVFLVVTMAGASRATEPSPTGVEPRWLDDEAHLTAKPPEAGVVRLEAHGEYQTRLRGQSALRLAPYRDLQATAELGQTTRLTHWLRFTPELSLGDRLRIVAQADLARGMLAGQPTAYVAAAREPYASRQPLAAEPRWLYFAYDHGIVGLSGGQQPAHWGLGMLENDGAHPVVWGDYAGGTRVERVAVRLHTLEARPRVEVELAADLVFADDDAELREDQRAARAIGSLRVGDPRGDMLGFIALYRRQTEPQPGAPDGPRAIARTLTLDVTGHFAEPIPGHQGAVFGGFEAAYATGDSTLAPLAPYDVDGVREAVSAVGAVVRLGAVLLGGAAPAPYGRFGATLEWGWASGDADPYDGTDRRFAMASDHNVGLLLFDEVLAWKTARAATTGQDPQLGPRPRPESTGLATNGRVAGATYLHPNLLYRPRSNLDLRAGAVVAQTTADLVDPVGLVVHGRLANYDGGPPTAHDLGVEGLLGTEWRVRTESDVVLALGGEAAALFPGHAFTNATGSRMKPVGAGIVRLGVDF